MLEALLILPAVACLILLDRQNKRHEAVLHTERTDLALIHVAYRAQAEKMFDAYRQDLAVLCQRIQAPELAVVEHQQRGPREPDSHPLTDEQIAQQQELAEVIARMERVENEGIVQ